MEQQTIKLIKLIWIFGMNNFALATFLNWKISWSWVTPPPLVCPKDKLFLPILLKGWKGSWNAEFDFIFQQGVGAWWIQAHLGRSVICHCSSSKFAAAATFQELIQIQPALSLKRSISTFLFRKTLLAFADSDWNIQLLNRKKIINANDFVFGWKTNIIWLSILIRYYQSWPTEYQYVDCPIYAIHW